MRPISAAYFTNARDDAGISFQNLQPLDQALGYLEVQTAEFEQMGMVLRKTLPPSVHGTYGALSVRQSQYKNSYVVRPGTRCPG
jgi:hypothetical protein